MRIFLLSSTLSLSLPPARFLQDDARADADADADAVSLPRIVFNGTWNGYVPLNCTYKFGSETPELEDGIICLPVGSDVVVTPVVMHHALSSTIPDP